MFSTEDLKTVPAVSVTAFIGVAVSLGWAVIRK